MHEQVVQCLCDFRTGTADGVWGTLADVFRAARIEAIRCLRVLDAAEKPFFSDEAKQRGHIAILRFDLLELGDFFGK